MTLNTFTIRRERNSETLRRILMKEPGYAAYALGDLEAPYAEHATWHVAEQADEVAGLALVYTALEPTVLFLYGDSPAVEALLAAGVGPDSIFFTARLEMEAALRAHYEVEHLDVMHRMQVTPAEYAPPTPEEQNETEIITLGTEHLPAIIQLIKETSKADSRDIRDIAFDAEMLDSGYYRGMMHNGALIAMAGTHLVTPGAGVAALGNVMTHPAHRGKGLGTLTSASVTEALLNDGFGQVVLNVKQDNIPAISIYERLGYRVVTPFIEGLADRKTSTV